MRERSISFIWTVSTLILTYLLTYRKRSIYDVAELFSQTLGLTKQQKNQIKNLKDREILHFASNDYLLLVCWKDSKPVCVLTNIHGTSLKEVSRRVKKKRRQQHQTSQAREDIFIPEAIADFTMNMRGVDKFDQFTSYYSFAHKSKRWYLRVATHLLELALVNTYILYKKSVVSGKPISQLDYRLEVIKELITPLRQSKKLTSTAEKSLKRKDMEVGETPISSNECYLDKIVDDKKKDCALCSRPPSARKQTHFQCRTCGLPVCVIKCYDQHRLSRNKRGKVNC